MVLALVERLLNRCVAESTRAQECRERLRGRALGITLAGAPFGIRLAVEGDELRASLDRGEPVDVRIATRPLELFKLLEADSVAALRRADASVRGDLEVADDFAELLRHARPELEDELARCIGDVPAHALGELARRALRWSADAGQAALLNLADYLEAETRLLADALALKRFARDVERTRDDVARLEQRLERLDRSLAQRSR